MNQWNQHLNALFVVIVLHSAITAKCSSYLIALKRFPGRYGFRYLLRFCFSYYCFFCSIFLFAHSSFGEVQAAYSATGVAGSLLSISWCFGRYVATPIARHQIVDRIISGVITSLSILTTCVLFAFFMSTYRGGMNLNWSATFDWFGSVAVIGFLIGFVIGFDRAVEMLAQLWGTSQSPNVALRIFLFVVLISLWILSYHFASGKL